MADEHITEHTFDTNDPFLADVIEVMNRHAKLNEHGIRVIDSTRVLASLTIVTAQVLAGTPDEYRAERMRDYWKMIQESVETLVAKRGTRVLSQPGSA